MTDILHFGLNYRLQGNLYININQYMLIVILVNYYNKKGLLNTCKQSLIIKMKSYLLLSGDLREQTIVL